ncbi:MAG: CRISPR system precrRNA processing endoribonuclease RAMP protein Cas6 [Thermomicrobiales bacterium]
MTEPLRITAIEIDGTVTRPLRFAGSPGEALYAALREAMLKRGCLRDRAHKGQCLNCALLPESPVWPFVAPADPTQRQRGPYLRPFVLRLPEIPPTGLPVGARVTYGMTMVQDTTFPALWGAFGAAFVLAARQVADWGFGLAVREGEQAARRGAISVGRARWRNPVTGENQPFTIPEGQPEPPPLIATFEMPSDVGASTARDAISLTFLTPTRLVAAGATLRRPEPDVLLRRVAERIDAVAASVGIAPPNLLGDDAFLASLSRLELRVDETRWMGDAARGGFTGPATFGGPPDDLARLPHILNWGAALGVGKGTLYGAGRFVVGPVPLSARVVMPDEQETSVRPATGAKQEQRRPPPKQPPQLRKRTPKGNRKR